MKRPVLLVFLLFIPLFLKANMAQSRWVGSLPGSPFISRYVDILHEKLVIIPNADFKTARFKVEYHIKSGKYGKQIPLLFYASDFKEMFKVWVDGQEKSLFSMPGVYDDFEKTPFTDFSYFFESDPHGNAVITEINESENEIKPVTAADLIYFETDITEGEHIIRVEYVANVWADLSNWVAEEEFRYTLTPARYWKSFGTLEVILDNSKTNVPLQTNLGQPKVYSPNGISRWEFSKLPMNVITIASKAEIPALAKALIAIDPFGLMLIFSGVLIAVHIFAIAWYRRSNKKAISYIVWSGSLVVPFIALASYMYFYILIDDIIGPAASRHHGYTFFIMALYVIVMPVYWIIMHFTDKAFKRK